MSDANEVIKTLSAMIEECIEQIATQRDEARAEVERLKVVVEAARALTRVPEGSDSLAVDRRQLLSDILVKMFPLDTKEGE